MGLGMWMTSGLEAMGWDSLWFRIKAVSWDWDLDGASWDSSLGEATPVVSAGCARAFVGSDETVSIEKFVSLSPRVEKPKLNEGNKNFVP